MSDPLGRISGWEGQALRYEHVSGKVRYKAVIVKRGYIRESKTKSRHHGFRDNEQIWGIQWYRSQRQALARAEREARRMNWSDQGSGWRRIS